MNLQRNDILDFIVNNILLDRLELEDEGYSTEDFAESTLILSEEGLGLDSVDVLDLIVGIEKKYGFSPIEIDSDYIDATCESIATVIDMVLTRTQQLAA
jgi:acyl carrier protein